MNVLVVMLLTATSAAAQPQTAPPVLDVYGNKGAFLNPGFPQDSRDSLDLLYTGHFIYSHPQWVRITMEYSLDGVMPACIDYIHVVGQNFSRCGKVISQKDQFVQEGGMLQMTAYSASKQSRKGFNVTYEVLGVLDLYTNAGSFTSPNFPNTYWDDLDLSYTAHLTSPDPQLLHIILDSQLEFAASYCYDFIILVSQNPNAKYCGSNNLTFDMVVDGDKLQMTFHTDFSIGKRGFNVTYYVIGPIKTTSISPSSDFLSDSSLPWTQTCTTCPVPAPSSTLLADWTEGTHFTDLALSTQLTATTVLTNFTLSTPLTSPTQPTVLTNFTLSTPLTSPTQPAVLTKPILSTPLTNVSDGAAPIDNYRSSGTDPTPTDSLVSSGAVDHSDVVAVLLALTTQDQTPSSDDVIQIVSSSYTAAGDVSDGLSGGTPKATVPSGITSSMSTIGVTPQLAQIENSEETSSTASTEVTARATDLMLTSSSLVLLPTARPLTSPSYSSPQPMEIITRQEMVATATTASEMKVITADLQTPTTTSDMEALATITSDTDTQTTAASDVETLGTLTSDMETLSTLTSDMETLGTLTSDMETQTTAGRNTQIQAIITSDMKTQNVVTSDTTTQTIAAGDTETTISATSDKKTSATPRTALDPAGCCRCQLLGGSETEKALKADEREKKIDEIIATLLVDKDNVSSTKRKHISAHDSRQSAAALGVVGVVLCALPVIFVLLMDVAGVAARAACGKKWMRAKNTVDAS